MHYLVYTIVPKNADNIMQAVYANVVPYQQDKCPEEYLSFIDFEDECREKFEKGNYETLRLRKDEPVPDQWINPFGAMPPLDIIPKSYEKVLVPLKHIYATFDEYMSKHRSIERDWKNGKYGYWANTNARWNDFRIGGRWTGALDRTYDSYEGLDNFEVLGQCANDMDSPRQCSWCDDRNERPQNYWNPFAGDVMPVAAFLADRKEKIYPPYAVVTPGKEWIEIPSEIYKAQVAINRVKYPKSRRENFTPIHRRQDNVGGVTSIDEWQAEIVEILKKYEDYLVVVTDCIF